jgi:hypoxanthine-DNA glycosylase
MPPAASDPTLRKRGFPPVVDARTRLLILGSLPGEKSLAVQEYYGNRQNRFWHFMTELLGADLVAMGYGERLDCLLRHGVGLWDVVAEASRKGSLDADLRDPRANDLLGLLEEFPRIDTLAFNGATAGRLGLRQLGRHAERFRIHVLPSSSPAHTLAPAEKMKQWRMLRVPPL